MFSYSAPPKHLELLLHFTPDNEEFSTIPDDRKQFVPNVINSYSSHLLDAQTLVWNAVCNVFTLPEAQLAAFLSLLPTVRARIARLIVTSIIDVPEAAYIEQNVRGSIGRLADCARIAANDALADVQPSNNRRLARAGKDDVPFRKTPT